MNKNLTEKLWNNFPLLYKGKNASIKESLIPFGFECGDGWYCLIWKLSLKLEPLIEEYIQDHLHTACYTCGCKYYEHRYMPSGKRICTTIHRVPYMPFKGAYGCALPQWKKDIKYYDFWKGFKKSLNKDWDYTKYRWKSKINKFCHKLSKIGLQYDLPCKCIEYEQPHPRASQVKEKYGTLSFYMTSATDKMWNLIYEAEEKSAKICEDCGKPGEIYTDGWCRTLCKECAMKNRRSLETE